MPEFLGKGADQDHIGLLDGRTDKPVCHCGWTNLESCDEFGNLMRVTGEYGLPGRRKQWPGLFRCDSCGRLVDGETREIVKGAQ